VDLCHGEWPHSAPSPSHCLSVLHSIALCGCSLSCFVVAQWSSVATREHTSMQRNPVSAVNASHALTPRRLLCLSSCVSSERLSCTHAQATPVLVGSCAKPFSNLPTHATCATLSRSRAKSRTRLNGLHRCLSASSPSKDSRRRCFLVSAPLYFLPRQLTHTCTQHTSQVHRLCLCTSCLVSSLTHALNTLRKYIDYGSVLLASSTHSHMRSTHFASTSTMPLYFLPRQLTHTCTQHTSQVHRLAHSIVNSFTHSPCQFSPYSLTMAWTYRLAHSHSHSPATNSHSHSHSRARSRVYSCSTLLLYSACVQMLTQPPRTHCIAISATLQRTFTHVHTYRPTSAKLVRVYCRPSRVAARAS
jgi:hypothetical protein